MKCDECYKQMDYLTGNDSPDDGYAYNVYHCEYCMILIKENVWKNPGKVIIYQDSTVTIVPKEVKISP